MADADVEMRNNEANPGMSRRPSRRMKPPTKTKIWLRGLETGPIIATIVFGFVFIILGILAILSGPSCACDLALQWWADQTNGTTPSSTAYSPGNRTCTECAWVFASCSSQGTPVECQRGCVLIVGSDPRETFCLAQAILQVFKNVPYVNFSVLQKLGLGVGLLGLAMIVFALGFAFYRGKQILK